MEEASARSGGGSSRSPARRAVARTVETTRTGVAISGAAAPMTMRKVGEVPAFEREELTNRLVLIIVPHAA